MQLNPFQEEIEMVIFSYSCTELGYITEDHHALVPISKCFFVYYIHVGLVTANPLAVRAWISITNVNIGSQYQYWFNIGSTNIDIASTLVH